MKKYYLHSGAEQQGPFDLKGMKAKRLSRESMVWYEGLPNWTAASNLDELRDFLSPVPPPFGGHSTPPSPPFVTTTPKVKEPAGKKFSSGQLIVIGGFIVLGLIGVFGYSNIGAEDSAGNGPTRVDETSAAKEQLEARQKEEERKRVKEAKKALVREDISSYVTTRPNNYGYNELGGIYGLKVIVSNTSDYVMDEVTVRVEYIKTTGRTWETRDVVLRHIRPNSEKVLPMPDSERGTSVRSEVVAVRSKELNM